MIPFSPAQARALSSQLASNLFSLYIYTYTYIHILILSRTGARPRLPARVQSLLQRRRPPAAPLPRPGPTRIGPGPDWPGAAPPQAWLRATARADGRRERLYRRRRHAPHPRRRRLLRFRRRRRRRNAGRGVPRASRSRGRARRARLGRAH